MLDSRKDSLALSAGTHLIGRGTITVFDALEPHREEASYLRWEDGKQIYTSAPNVTNDLDRKHTPTVLSVGVKA
jgi:hypothetical protein